MQDQPPVMTSTFHHKPVLASAVVESLNSLPAFMLDGGLMIDATIGGGGHCELVLETYPKLRLIGLDQDPNARNAAQKRLVNFGKRIEIVESNFANFNPPEEAIYVLADLGVSSPQLDNAKRGFSFRLDGPLDMRMNPTQEVTAAELIQRLNEKELADIIFNYGEERLSRRIARKIKNDLLEAGPYKGTAALAYAIAGCYPPKQRYSRIHPATRTFQALRIAVNNELQALESFLENAPDWLVNEGLLNIISFHSLEDRRVKTAFNKDERIERITRKPITAKGSEVAINPRSRSAKCRIARRKPLKHKQYS